MNEQTALLVFIIVMLAGIHWQIYRMQTDMTSMNHWRGGMLNGMNSTLLRIYERIYGTNCWRDESDVDKDE